MVLGLDTITMEIQNTKKDFKNGKIDGSVIFYHENGQLKTQGVIKNGWGEGISIKFFDNGQVKSKGMLKNGYKVGSWVSFNRDGSINKRETGTFKDSEKISN